MRTALFALAVATLFATGCGNLFDPAAAVVDGEKITISKLEAELEQYRETSRYQQLVAQAPKGEIERTFQQDTLTLFIREAVLEEEAEERGIEVTPEEVNERIDRAKEEAGSESAFMELLREAGYTLEQAELQVRVQLLAEELRAEVTKGVGPSEEELRSYYEDHIEKFQEVRAQHILLDADKLALAEDLALRLQKADQKEVEKLFESLAQRYSADPSTADEGGDLGWAPPGQYAPPFTRALLDLEVGVVSDPIQTQFGWHVIRVEDRRKVQPPPFEAVAPQLREGLMRQKFEETMAALRQGTPVEIVGAPAATETPAATDAPASG